MSEYEKRKGHVRLAFIAVSVLAFFTSSIYLWWDYKVVFPDFGFTELNSIATSPPFDFVKADSLLQNTLEGLKNEGLDHGPVLPFLNGGRTLDERYSKLAEIHGTIALLAQFMPDSASANADTSKQFVSKAKELCVSAKDFSAMYARQHQTYTKKSGTVLLFFLSLWGVALGAIKLKKED